MTKKLLAVAISAALMGSVAITSNASADEGSHSFPAQCWHPSKNVLKNSASNHPGVCDEAIEHWQTEHSGETSVSDENESPESELESESPEPEVEDENTEGESTEVEGEVSEEEPVGTCNNSVVVESEESDAEESEEGDNETEEGEAVDESGACVSESEVELEVSESEVELEVEVEVEVTAENIVEELSESGEIGDADATLEALEEAGLTVGDVPEDLQDDLPITDDPVVVDETTPETNEETEGSEEAEVSEGSEEAEVSEGSEEAEISEEAEVPEGAEAEESVEIPTEPLKPEDVEENTFSMGLTVEEQEVIETQLEVVKEVVVGVDEEGNDIISEVQDTQVIGEVLVPSEDAENADEDGVNALLFGEPVNIAAELGVAEATVVDGETQILTTVSGVKMGEVSEDVDVENIDSEETINLEVDDDGNVSLTIPNLEIGDLTVNVKLRALTDALDVYQVQEVTVAPEEVFVSETETQSEEPVDEPVEEPVVDEPVEEPVVDEPVEEPVVEELAAEEPEIAPESEV